MKIFLSLFVVLSFSVFANEPKVGDFALFNLKSGEYSGTYKMELTEYDSEDNTYVVTSTTTVGEEVNVEIETVSSEDVATQELLQYVVMNCESENIGVSEEVNVTAGKFKTCKVEEDGSSTHMGIVPFGVIKTDSPEGSLELVKFGYAQ